VAFHTGWRFEYIDRQYFSDMLDLAAFASGQSRTKRREDAKDQAAVAAASIAGPKPLFKIRTFDNLPPKVQDILDKFKDVPISHA
jgi:hypothetical protein